MDVALDGGEHDGALLLALDAFHQGFEMGDGGLHGLGTLQHEGELHLSRTEQFADDFHAVEQDVVDDVERLVNLQRVVQFVGEALAIAVDDAVLEPALDSFGALLLDGIGKFAVSENFEQALQRVVALAPTVEN